MVGITLRKALRVKIIFLQDSCFDSLDRDEEVVRHVHHVGHRPQLHRPRLRRPGRRGLAQEPAPRLRRLRVYRNLHPGVLSKSNSS